MNQMVLWKPTGKSFYRLRDNQAVEIYHELLNFSQQTALRCSEADQYPVAALKHRIALVHPLAQAAGLLMICRIFIQAWYQLTATLSFRAAPCPMRFTFRHC